MYSYIVRLCHHCQVFFQIMPQHHLVNGFVVVPLNLEIGYFAVTLSRADLVMTQQVLDDDQVGIGIEQLSGHGVSKLVTVYL